MVKRPPKTEQPVEARSYRLLFWLLALLNMVAILWVVWDEHEVRRPWKGHQRRFNRLLQGRGKSPLPVRIEQTTIPELGVVDRCRTCHLGIDRAGFGSRDIPKVYRTHTRRNDLLKHHPASRFGCTPCHHGQGPQTKGVLGRPFDHGRNDPFWERPLLSGAFVESTCVACHDREDPIAGAETYNEGRRLFEDLRCFGCHATTQVKPGFAAAPPLDQLSAKTSRAFVEAWLEDPTRWRPTARMPQFWPPPVDPPSGRLAPKGSPVHKAWSRRRKGEIQAIAAFLGTLRPKVPLPAVEPPDVDAPALAARGRELFRRLGCRGCHSVIRRPEDRAGLSREERFAPDLAGVGARVTVRWLVAWLSGPSKVWRRARMPDLRLSREQRDALVAYLVTLRPEGTPGLVEPRWPPPRRSRIEQGRKAVLRYGCYGCHEIPGFEQAGRAGPGLEEFGDRTADRLAWGRARLDCRRPDLECWTLAKLQTPRRMRDRNLDPVMPDQRLTPKEALALSVFVLANRSTAPPPAYRVTPGQRRRRLLDGERLVARHNCRGCHEIGRHEERVLDDDGELVEVRYRPIGGHVRRLFDDVALAPPPLTFAGEKFQYPWLVGFLESPSRIRPWLEARMPTFALDARQRTSLAAYFAARNGAPFPFDPVDAGRLTPEAREDAVWIFRKFQCHRCHEISNAKTLKPGELSPDLALAGTRLKPGWLRKWLLDPQRLQPGTKMPNYFPLADDDDPNSHITPVPDRLGGDVKRQVDALVKLNMELGRMGGGL